MKPGGTPSLFWKPPMVWSLEPVWSDVPSLNDNELTATSGQISLHIIIISYIYIYCLYIYIYIYIIVWVIITKWHFSDEWSALHCQIDLISKELLLRNTEFSVVYPDCIGIKWSNDRRLIFFGSTGWGSGGFYKATKQLNIWWIVSIWG